MYSVGVKHVPYKMFIVPVSAVSGSHNDGVGDEGTSAESGSIKVDAHLVGELVTGGRAPTDDATAVDG